MDSICEQQRLLHEEIEFLEKEMCTELLKKHLTHKDKINSDHRVKRMMDVGHFSVCQFLNLQSISAKSKQLLEIYEDKDGCEYLNSICFLTS